jgi:hypothetical protein
MALLYGRAGRLTASKFPPAFQGQDIFYERAAVGSLPQFSFINPPDEACDHPCHDMVNFRPPSAQMF